MILFNYSTDFSYFPLKTVSRRLLDTVRTGKNDHFERGCKWFQLFFIDFSYFIFLTRIIPEISTSIYFFFIKLKFCLKIFLFKLIFISSRRTIFEDWKYFKKLIFVDFEVKRQIKVLENSGSVENETRSFDTESG